MTGAGAMAAMVLMASSALAFDSKRWQEKHDAVGRDAERLRTAYANCLAQVAVPAEDVTVPLETFDDGAVKVAVFAKKAQYFLDKGLVWAEGVVVRRFKPDGSVEVCIEAQNCVVDRKTKSGWAEGPATVVHGKTVFRGRGVYFSSPQAYVRVHDDSDVQSEDLKFGGVAP